MEANQGLGVFTFHHDPGHGWLQVPVWALKRTRLNPSDFSNYSYRSGNTVFLEEDCDAPKFIDAWQAKYGSLPVVEEHMFDTYCYIREFARII